MNGVFGTGFLGLADGIAILSLILTVVFGVQSSINLRSICRKLDAQLA